MDQPRWRADLGLLKILCATDGSAASFKAVDFAVQLARTSDLPLTFISIFEPEAVTFPENALCDAQLLEMAQILTDSVFGHAACQANENMLSRVRFVKAYGSDIAAAIAEYADFNGYELIVVGTHGQSVLKKILLGSVAASLIQKATCPVTVVR